MHIIDMMIVSHPTIASYGDSKIAFYRASFPDFLASGTGITPFVHFIVIDVFGQDDRIVDRLYFNTIEEAEVALGRPIA